MKHEEQKNSCATPRWRSEFPIHQNEEAKVTRRGFIAYLGAAGACAGLSKLQAETQAEAAGEGEGTFADVGPVDGFAAGTSCMIRLPDGEVALLVHQAGGTIVAYDPHCTHLLCPVHYDEASNNIKCPCHHGVFAVEDGRALAGPPKKALRGYEVEVSAGRIRLRLKRELAP